MAGLFSKISQCTDDEAASGAPERFAFRQRANVAQAFGHAAQAWAKYQRPSHARIFKGTRTILHPVTQRIKQKLKPPHTTEPNAVAGIDRVAVAAKGAPRDVGADGPNAAAQHTEARC